MSADSFIVGSGNEDHGPTRVPSVQFFVYVPVKLPFSE